MPKLRKKTGSPKGVPKPIKHRLDRDFHLRLSQAMDEAKPKLGPSDLAGKARVERQTVHNCLKPGKAKIEAAVLFALADALEVSPRWLLLGGTPNNPKRAFTADQEAVLRILSEFRDSDLKDAWLTKGRELSRRRLEPDTQS